MGGEQPVATEESQHEEELGELLALAKMNPQSELQAMCDQAGLEEPAIYDQAGFAEDLREVGARILTAEEFPADDPPSEGCPNGH